MNDKTSLTIARANAKLQASKKAFSKSVRAVDFSASVHANKKKESTAIPENSQIMNNKAAVNVKSVADEAMDKSKEISAPIGTISGKLFQIIDFLKVCSRMCE